MQEDQECSCTAWFSPMFGFNWSPCHKTLTCVFIIQYEVAFDMIKPD
jgi:hypothetical protein